MLLLSAFKFVNMCALNFEADDAMEATPVRRFGKMCP